MLFFIFRKLRLKRVFASHGFFSVYHPPFRIILCINRMSNCYSMNSYTLRFSHKTERKHVSTFVSENSMEFISKNNCLKQEFEEGILIDNFDREELELLSERFKLKGLDIRHMHKYNIKVSHDKSSMMFPYDGMDKELATIQYLNYKNDIIGERLESSFPFKSSNAVLFGWSLVGRSSKDIIVTSDPLDAIAANQETGVPAVALLYDFITFPAEVLNVLKEFKKVILWLKPHQHDWKLHKLFSSALGKAAFFVRPNVDYNGALSSLQSECKLQQVLREVHSLRDNDIETFESYKDVIYNEFKGHERYAGRKWKRFSVLNEVLKGHRKGELTVFSGQTGTGKTTFMSEYSLDLCVQGVPTLWGSFEVTNTKLMKTMLKQYARCSFMKNLDEYEHWSQQFLQIPMFFMNFHGQRSIKRVIQAMTHCVIVYSIEHIVIDNLQFMMNMEDYNSTMDQLRRQDQIFAAFREFATQHSCHITLVMHPRKEPEFAELSNTSISGTAKATQEADNILILQTTKSRQYLQVTKNRFDGQKGCVIVEFNKESQTFTVKKITKLKNIEKPEMEL